MIARLLAVLLAASPIIIRTERNPDPVIVGVQVNSDWARTYVIDLPRPWVYGINFVCGRNEYAYVAGLRGPGAVEVKIVTTFRAPECYINDWTVVDPALMPADGGTDGGVDGGFDGGGDR